MHAHTPTRQAWTSGTAAAGVATWLGAGREASRADPG